MDVVERLSVFPKSTLVNIKPLPVSSLLSVAWSLVRNVKTLARILPGGRGVGVGGTPFDGQIRWGFAQRGYIFQALRMWKGRDFTRF